MIIDLHCDTISVLTHKEGLNLLDNDLQVDINKLKAGNYLAQCFALFTYLKQEAPYEDTLKMLSCFQKEIKNNKLNLATSVNSLNPNELNAILTIEDLGVIEEDLSRLDYLYESGVRIASLTWNFKNSIGYPNKINLQTGKTEPDNENGLTEFGKKVINIMEEKGIIIDVSHLSDKGFWDVLNNTTKPFIATHSNSRSICNHTRNLSDEMIIALNKRGGVMGMNFCTAFINSDAQITTVKDIIKHIDYIKKIASIDVIALGTDFDGIGRTTEIDNASQMGILIDALKTHGYTYLEINKITHLNFLRVFGEVCHD